MSNRFMLPAAVHAVRRDEDGQDILEYGLLSAFFGIVCIVVWLLIQGNLASAYTAYTSDGGRVQSIWQSPDPGGS